MNIQRCSNEGCLTVAYNSFSQSKAGISLSLAAAITAIVIGILGTSNVLPRVGTTGGTFFLGLGGLLFALAVSRTNQSQGHVLNIEWKEKLEKLKAENKNVSLIQCDVPPIECLNSLSFLAQRGISSQLFKESIPYIEPENKNMKGLLTECQNKKEEELYLNIAVAFLENLPILNDFIDAQTQAILLLNEPSEEKRRQFKLLNKQFRMILLFLISYEPEKSIYLKYYKSHIQESFGNRTGYINGNQPCHYFHRLLSLNKNMNDEFYKFLYSFSIYRRHSLLRLFSKKIDTHSNCQDVELRTLLSATWFHGTRAATSLSDTDFTLMPTGWLHQIGLTSFFGEMQDGCGKNGVNANCLSGTYLDRVHWSMNSYATGFQFDVKNEIDAVESFLNRISTDEDIDNSIVLLDIVILSPYLHLPRLEVALKRLARWDQSAYKKQLPDLLSKIKHLKNAIEAIEHKRIEKEIFEYKDHFSKYENLCLSVNQIHAFLNGPLPKALTKAEKKNVQENFPAVFGSLTLLSKPFSYDDHTGEHLVRGTAQLGKDLQLFCVEEANLAKAKKWVKNQLPKANIQIFSFDQLKEAQKINRIVSPYLADIFSLNKFNKLCETI